MSHFSISAIVLGSFWFLVKHLFFVQPVAVMMLLSMGDQEQANNAINININVAMLGLHQ